VHALPQLARKPSSVRAVLFVVVRITVATPGVRSSVALSGAPTRILTRHHTSCECVDKLAVSRWLGLGSANSE
jgi:hypothetical protein